MKTRNNIFSELAANLKLRRNLESALRPSARIGILSAPNQWESTEAFNARIKESRDRNARESQNLLETHNLDAAGAAAKIAELRGAEALLWDELKIVA
jgi:hypothetical protein